MAVFVQWSVIHSCRWFCGQAVSAWPGSIFWEHYPVVQGDGPGHLERCHLQPCAPFQMSLFCLLSPRRCLPYLLGFAGSVWRGLLSAAPASFLEVGNPFFPLSNFSLSNHHFTTHVLRFSISALKCHLVSLFWVHITFSHLPCVLQGKCVRILLLVTDRVWGLSIHRQIVCSFYLVLHQPACLLGYLKSR